MGGSLRAQSLRRPEGEPIVLNGTLLRVDPATGAGLPTNPFAASSDANERRIIAYGLRNPFRFAFRPGSSEVWIADVGAGLWEEIDRLPEPTTARNFGWPCYEGNATQPHFSSLDQCASLYPGTTAPASGARFAYRHGSVLGAMDTCGTGVLIHHRDRLLLRAFLSVGFRDALFFGDHSRSCIWVVFPGTNGLPDWSTVQTFIDDADAPDPVDIQTDPVSGDVFYVDYDSGAVMRISALAPGSS